MVCVFPGLETTYCLLVRTLEVIAIDAIIFIKRTGRYRERLQTLLFKKSASSFEQRVDSCMKSNSDMTL